MDKRKQLYNLYKERGLISDAVSEDVFLSANESQQEQLYNLGKQNELFESTDFGTFQSAWEPIKKKEESDLPLEQEDTSLATPEMEPQEPSAFSQFQKEDSEYKPFASFGPVKSKAKTVEAQKIEKEKVLEESEKGIFKDVAVNPGDLMVVQDKGVSKVRRDYEPLKSKANQLQEKYGDLGFKFDANESTYFGDDIIVTADDGTSISINTSSINENNVEDAKKLQEFLFSKSAGQKKRELTPAEMLIYSDRNKYEGFSKSKYDRIYTDENIKKSLDFVNEKINADISGVKESQKEISELQAQIESLGESASKETLEEFNSKVKMYNSKIKDIKSSAIIADQSVKNIVAERIERDIDRGNWASATYNGFVNGAEDLAKGVVDVLYEGTDMITRPLLPMDREKKHEQEKKIKEWLTSAFDEKRARGITDAYINSKGMALKALFSVPEFLPTLMMPGGPIARIAAMTTQGVGRRMEEYDNSPEMQKMMSREEAFLINTLKSTIEAKLENVGITQAFSRSGLANSMIVKALQKWAPNMGPKALNTLANAEVNSLAAKAVLNTAGAFIVEAETGALQNIMETGINELYNVAKEKQVFEQPKVFTKEWTEGLVKDAVMEGLGGMWMGGAINVSRYTAEGVLGKRLSNEEFSIVKKMLNDGITMEAMMVDLKNQVINGNITAEESSNILNNFKKAASIVNQMPEGDLSEGQQRGAFDLINERTKLESEIAGKDPNLVSRKTKRIAEINERLKLISENAVQEQTTSEVPVQPEATVGEEVAQGEPQAKPEVAAEETVEEEVEIPTVTMKEALDNPSGVYVLDGKKGNLTVVDGNILAFETEDQIVDLGSMEEISESSIEEFGISQESTVDLTLNEDNSITYNGVNYYNNYSDPDAAIDTDKDGNYVVRLETENGQKRTFRGQQAQEIVYQTRLKNFEQNATEEQIESANELADEAIRVEEQARETAPKRKGKVVREAKRKPTKKVDTVEAQVTEEAVVEEEKAEPKITVEEEVSESKAIEEAVAEEESRPLEARKPRIQAIEEESSKIKKSASNKNFTARQANELKKALRKFINDSLPKAMWTTPEVKKIINEIQRATIKKNYNRLIEKPQDDIRQVMSKVIDLVNEKSSKIYMAEVKKVMDVRTEEKESGRMKGKFTAEGVDRINQFKEDMSLDEKSPLDQIDSKIEELKKEKEQIEEKADLTEEDLRRLEMIDIAMLYNSALTMDNKSQAKSISLEEAARKIKIVLSGARSEFREFQKAKHERYIQEQQDALESITGMKVDLKDPESVKKFERELEALEEKEKNKKGIKGFLSKTAKILDNAFVLRVEAMEGLLDRITIESAEVFGGKLSVLIKDRVDESARNYKKNKKETLDKIEEKAKEIYGKNWRSEMKENSKKTVKIYLDSKRVEELNNELKTTTDLKKRRKIVEEIEKLTKTRSQNEMYYHYNQYKDPSNHPSYEEKYENPSDVMKQIEEKLNPKVKEWADWQVNEFFPSVYNQYNEVYRRIYNTNMPWNEFYAGRIFRETKDEIDTESIGLMDSRFQNGLTNASTKARVKNKQKIRDMDGNSTLLSYVSDMEYFRSYAENMRDISKIFSRKDGLVKKAITATTSESTYDVLFNQDASSPGMLAKIMNRGFNMRGSESKVLDVMTRNFVISKLGLNPTIFLKQMTSALAFADYIGYRNWAKYGLMEMKNGIAGFNSSWKELYENSVELQSRYDSKDFTRVLESYNKQDQDILSGNVSMGKFMDFMMYLVKQGDKGGVMGSIPNYAYYKDVYKKKNPNASNQQAIDYAVKKVEQEVKSTQQDQDIQNKDFYQTGNWYQRWLSMFQSSSRALLRKEILATRNLYRKMSKMDAEAGTGTLRQNIRMFTTYHVVLPMFFQYIALGLPGLLTDMDDEDKEALGMAAVLGNLNSLFVAGQIFNMLIDYVKGNPWAGDSTDLPILELANGVFKDINNFNKAKTEATKNKYIMKILGSTLDLGGIPGSQANKLYQNYKKISDIDFKNADDYKEATARLFGYTDYQIEPPKKKGKTVKMKKVKTAFD